MRTTPSKTLWKNVGLLVEMLVGLFVEMLVASRAWFGDEQIGARARWNSTRATTVYGLSINMAGPPADARATAKMPVHGYSVHMCILFGKGCEKTDLTDRQFPP